MNDGLHRTLDLFAGCRPGPLPVRSAAAQALPIVSMSPSRRLIRDLKSKGYAHSHHFMLLPSLSNPRWLLPLGNSKAMLAGSQIYVPHKPMARLMKRVVASMIKRGWDGWGCRKVLVASGEALPFEDLVREVTGETRPLFAMSLGTRPAVSKLTVQVMVPEGKILGYIKVPLGDAATRRVQQEAAMLERLWQFPILRPHIPRLFYAGSRRGTYLLFQSPLQGEPSPTRFTDVHAQFLRALGEVHWVSKPGLNLVQEVATKWEGAVLRLGRQWEDLGREALRRATSILDGKNLTFGVMHGDFAPWNTRVVGEALLAFDWESADWEAPHGWDGFHFHVQTASSLDKNNIRSFLARADSDQNASSILYLLSSVCQFLEEDNPEAIEYRRKLLVTLLLASN